MSVEAAPKTDLVSSLVQGCRDNPTHSLAATRVATSRAQRKREWTAFLNMARRAIRSNALEKLARLSAQSSAEDASTSDFARFFKRCPNVSSSMKLQELEAILALCKSAPFIESIQVADKLLARLSPYLTASYAQTLAPSPSLRTFEPSPYQVLTYNLTSAVLSLGLRHDQLRAQAATALESYVDGWAAVAAELSEEQFVDDGADDYSTHGELARVMTHSLSLLGFLGAAAEQADFWNADDRLRLVEKVRSALTENFLVAFETVLSIVRNARSHQHGLREWKRYTKHYAATGRPLGAMILHDSFLNVVLASASQLVGTSPRLTSQVSVLDHLQRYLDSKGHRHLRASAENSLAEGLVRIAEEEMERLENDLDYLQRVGSAWQQQQASSVKAKVLVTYLCCTVYDDDTDITDAEVLTTWLDNVLNDPAQSADHDLASTVLKSMAILARVSPHLASTLGRSLPRVIVQANFDNRTTSVAAESLAAVLSLLPQDAIITTLYSLGNVISVAPMPERTAPASPTLNGKTRGSGIYNNQNGSTISLTPSDVEEPHHVHTTVVETIVSVARNCKDPKITALALSMLIQKVGRSGKVVDAKIITDSALLGIHSPPGEFRSLLKVYTKLSHDALVADDRAKLEAVMAARLNLSREICANEPSFEIYLTHLLDTIVSKGDAQETSHRHLRDTELAAQEIAQLLKPLALLLGRNAERAEFAELDDSIICLQRDAWFNIVVHGFDLQSDLGKEYREELRTLARFSKPLIAEERPFLSESDIELNTVLRRGKSPEHTVEQKKRLGRLLPSCEADTKSLSYQEAVFLSTAYLVEDLRASTGDCTKALAYFLDPKLRTGAVGNCMTAIATTAIRTYLTKSLSGQSHSFSTPYLAQQLAKIFSACCHRIARVQQAAASCADVIVREVPSTLCQKSALFALLELLSIMWYSCLEGETDEYTWKSTFASKRSNIVVELSDDYTFRRATLDALHTRATVWVRGALDIAPLDVKGLLQSYLSEFDDETSFGHISLGRSFALEMGSLIPSTDQRLGAVERQGININTASDFITQYTTRQEYKFLDGVVDQEEEWLNGAPTTRRMPTYLSRSLHEATNLLVDFETRTLNHKHVTIAELRDILRRAAALLCRVKTDQSPIVQHLVGIPFAVFSKQSIKLGISLWTSVAKENPRMESRILVAIAENWENTVRKRRGIFSPALKHEDPFFGKQEFAATDKEALSKRQQQIYNLIAPHFRLLQFLSSHFSASRLGKADVERVYVRMMNITLDAMSVGCSQPLARESYFHIILLGLRIARHCTTISATIRWRLSDRILTAALAWFAKAPQWSFGGNRLQIKAETHILADVQAQLDIIGKSTTAVDISAKLKARQDLLSLLVGNEQTRLMVWLFPLDYGKKHHFTSGRYNNTLPDAAVTAHLKTAWAENPAIAVHLIKRFQSQRLNSEVRWQVLNFPHKVLDEPDALEILLGNSLPADVSFQLKYLLYWAPVNPITAVTYFLPAYGNHPFIIQYAMRALESHSVDVMFFYVYQIVQTLRYDVLGYVERYIIETAKFSQLFAHQIIWNMKANAYKDETAEVPDPVKPTLDKVMASLESSFSKEDHAFYEREFAFFNEVTGISGTLRSVLHEPKEVKKQKIEEELRKIKVEVGVYLPSNPDGQVIGIDRKSGKPLQSHAKTPFMATFRIRKTRPVDQGLEETEDDDRDIAREKDRGYETWLSAIFKVGDDCRQDVLALQMIAAFRGIFNTVGLDVWVFPYRVTATAPGCGVIDVLPNSISRDMLGREAVNRLDDYFVSRYGNEDSIRYQEARSNFVKSMAAYSVISFLLQFKDRHNGNIMIDDAGHIIHIDFGFCFDIAPGGIKFERAPFKLTAEMIAVMSGKNAANAYTSQAYRWFEELTVKAFLASRQHCDHLCHVVQVMLDSGLPCFKPESMKNFRDRFVLERSEREAADYMRGLIEKSRGSYSTGTYDRFQLITNGIPY
ncbi:TEL1 Phosphatidylinositol kinase and protein kinase of the PI-3 kinase family [Pyrenophora tritici-repentis]|uniref:1-phosphatidylinositol 4-kinase n=1 Tax=Pyrenophora tritici-repentis (strain Pt-1C-BFP) TaxID=426418 RepID=B2VZW3_PYRTR|nr:phosphatidylinositol 3-kinase 3 [Pyrenophora tritici-repentis Pt-1C-BFP]KAI1550390.1 TEL1 Phosphatidylinositol kinase and protein kinase of the PI-3 kinase family [Pyrenophora tritici-repentis]EDU45476.1 phosphatidylinositol 3-kinase 3 [Pyrenophora tritici-repentis Pt-1C-BFP]KAI1558664.1 TEL1 Phosphatidylinositol kinase and protein kinase of the PI-3 kinase family [Pyrenophora tritici-repentis]KAI1585871.1 TEL1 Phosphatidylinositol kinase and protein kinase of the PI-3 kinase family [Pyrenop